MPLSSLYHGLPPLPCMPFVLPVSSSTYLALCFCLPYLASCNSFSSAFYFWDTWDCFLSPLLPCCFLPYLYTTYTSFFSHVLYTCLLGSALCLCTTCLAGCPIFLPTPAYLPALPPLPFYYLCCSFYCVYLPILPVPVSTAPLTFHPFTFVFLPLGGQLVLRFYSCACSFTA